MNTQFEQSQKLYRSRSDCKIAGVCGGLAKRYGFDSSWVRIFFVLFFLVGGSAFLVYVIMWLIVPLEPNNTSVKTIY
jgi:phage shock protein C